MFAAGGDVITFSCALALVLSPLSSVTYNLVVGYLMSAFHGDPPFIFLL